MACSIFVSLRCWVRNRMDRRLKKRSRLFIYNHCLICQEKPTSCLSSVGKTWWTTDNFKDSYIEFLLRNKLEQGKKELLPRLRAGMQHKLLLIVPVSHFALYPPLLCFYFLPLLCIQNQVWSVLKAHYVPWSSFLWKWYRIGHLILFCSTIVFFWAESSVLQVGLGSISTSVALWVYHLASFSV